MTDENARALAAKRRRIDSTCQQCGAAIVTRLKGKADEPERRYCSPACRVKAYYLAHKSARLEYQRKRRAAHDARGATGEEAP